MTVPRGASQPDRQIRSTLPAFGGKSLYAPGDPGSSFDSQSTILVADDQGPRKWPMFPARHARVPAFLQKPGTGTLLRRQGQPFGRMSWANKC
jgi:hypothetical protein